LLGLAILPTGVIIYFIWKNNKYASLRNTDLEIESSSKGTDLRLQYVQIIGLLTTLSIPITAVHSLDSISNAVLQVQLKIATVIITVGGAFYLSIQRDAYAASKKLFKSKIIPAMLFSFMLSMIISFMVNLNQSRLGFVEVMPDFLSWLSLTIYVTLQPLNISVFYLVMRFKFYSTLALAGTLNFILFVGLANISAPRLGLNAFFYSIVFSSVISAIPMYRKLKSRSFFDVV
jgi:hypothetical protein